MNLATMPDGKIDPDSQAGQQIGFSADLFEGYLWKQGNRVLISLLVSLSPRRGHLMGLFNAIEAAGFNVAVPTPLGAMQGILASHGFIKTTEVDAAMGPVDVWVRP